MAFQIITQDRCVWAERSFRSFQKQPLTLDDAREVVLATHRIIGLFFRRHDPAFHWTDEPRTTEYGAWLGLCATLAIHRAVPDL